MGRIDKIVGMTIEATGPSCNIGDVCEIEAPKGEERFYAEVVGFRENKVLLMPYDEMEGIGYGSAVKNTGDKLRIPVTNALIGRTVDALGSPIDGKGPIQGNAKGSDPFAVHFLNCMRKLGKRQSKGSDPFIH